MANNTADGYVIIDLQLQQDQFDKRLSEVESKTVSFGSKIKGALLAIGIGTMAKKAAEYIYNVGSSFEETMSKVQAISGATGKELEALTAKAKEMGAKTKFSATQAGEAFTYMAMAGWKTGDMLDGIEGIMNLAAASGEDLAAVSDIVTDALTAFGLSAKDSAHFADVLAKASSASNTNVGMMGETFKYVAPVAGALKYSVEDTAVAIGLMANSGIKSSQAGTALRSILSRLTKPTDAVAAAMDKLNISLTDSKGNIKPLNVLMADLRKVFSKLTDAQKTEMAATLGGQEAMSALLAIVNASDKDYKSLTDQINNADGAAKQMADTMQNNLKGSLTIMQSALEGIGISIYEKIAPTLKKLVDFITNDVLSAIGELVNGDFSKIKDFVPIIESITVAFVGLKGAMALNDAINSFKNMKKGLLAWQMATRGTAVSTGVLNGQLTIGQGVWALLNGQMTIGEVLTYAQAKAWGVLNAVINANPIAKVVALLAILAAGFIYLWNTNEDFRNFWIELWNDIVEFVNDAVDSIVKFFTEDIPEAFNNFLLFVDELAVQITTFFSDMWLQIVNFFMQTIPAWIDNVIQFFQKIPYYIGYMIGYCIAQFIQWGLDLWNFATVTIPEFINKVIEWFASLPGKIWTWLVGAYNNVVSWGSNTYSSAKDWVSKTISSIVSYFSSLPSKIWTWLVNTVDEIARWGTNLFKKGKESADKLVKSVVDGVSSLPGQMLDIGKNIVDGIWKGISGAAGWLKDKISDFAGGVVDGIKDFFGIHSPSKLMADEVGKFLPKGLAVGFEAEIPNTERQITQNARVMVDNFKDEVNDSATRNQSNGNYDPKPYDDGEGNGNGIDYVRLGNTMINALSQAGLTVRINEREFGRLEKEVQ